MTDCKRPAITKLAPPELELPEPAREPPGVRRPLPAELEVRRPPGLCRPLPAESGVRRPPGVCRPLQAELGVITSALLTPICF